MIRRLLVALIIAASAVGARLYLDHKLTSACKTQRCVPAQLEPRTAEG
jgi:hypothetical protein